MSDRIDPDAQQRMGTAASAAFIAMQYVSDPRNWPAFAAWAEQQVPEDTWDENDRRCMARDSRLLCNLAIILDNAGGAR